MNDAEFQTLAENMQRSLELVAQLPNDLVREQSVEIVQALLSFYGEGLHRILSIVERVGREDPQARRRILEEMTDDELVAHLLMLHDLHPDPVEERVESALEEVRPYLASHGGNVELIGIEDGVVRLRLEGSCHGCPSSTQTLKNAIEEAIYKRAPDIAAIEADGALEEPKGFVALGTVGLRPRHAGEVHG